MVGVLVAFLHPLGDVAARRNLPLMHVCNVAELFELLADPERPVSVAARVADEDVRHAPPPATHDDASCRREI
jgi:hypothetical protein